MDVAIIGWAFNLIIFLLATHNTDDEEMVEAFLVIAIVPFSLFVLFFYCLLLEIFK